MGNCGSNQDEFTNQVKRIESKLKEIKKCKESILNLDFNKIEKIQKDMDRMQKLKNEADQDLKSLENYLKNEKTNKPNIDYSKKEIKLNELKLEYKGLEEIKEEDALKALEKGIDGFGKEINKLKEKEN
jgi:uncharacterized protein YpuA (DUF1002 family)